jgi:hypothetical protein
MADKAVLRTVKSLNDFVRSSALRGRAVKRASRAAHEAIQRRPFTRQSATDPPCAPPRAVGRHSPIRSCSLLNELNNSAILNSLQSVTRRSWCGSFGSLCSSRVLLSRAPMSPVAPNSHPDAAWPCQPSWDARTRADVGPRSENDPRRVGLPVISLSNAMSVVIQLAAGNARIFLQITRAICGTGQSTINVMVKEINKGKPL